MSFKAQSSYKNYPSNWNDFKKLLEKKHPQLVKDIHISDMFRFSARYKLAKSILSISLKEYSSTEISDAYCGLIKLFLTYSAFEYYTKLWCIPNDLNNLNNILSRYNHKAISQKIHSLDKDNKLFTFIYDKIRNKTIKTQVDFYIKKGSHNIIFLAEAIRHTFAHGYLTPHTQGSNPVNINAICNLLSEFILDLIDREFSSNIERYKI